MKPDSSRAQTAAALQRDKSSQNRIKTTHLHIFKSKKKITCTQLRHQFHQGIPLAEQEWGNELMNPFTAALRPEFDMSILILIPLILITLILIILILIYLAGFIGFGNSQGTRKHWESGESYFFEGTAGAAMLAVSCESPRVRNAPRNLHAATPEP